ncbi:MAG: excinuclease ABC subunit C [Saprospiraceae bacterium]|nr:excinuclease ABC subunit C [Saprospiraceae bacterium]MBP7679845.1 excinuclease ABC subunit C [Saprospiraceae bacterium]
MTYEDYQHNLLPILPIEPGVYRFISPSGEILYVGKAKNLRSRVASYFGERKDKPQKVAALVRHAQEVTFTIVESEHDALLLECTLIKEFQPRYNVMLKDGRSYPYICIKQERFPRVFITRKVIKDGSLYFGPYIAVKNVYAILDLIKNLFPLRTCQLALTEENIRKGKFKVCLEYHIKNCAGSCVGFETTEDYNKKIQQIKNILRGNFASVKTHFKQEMIRHSENMDFEKAQALKDKLSAFEDYQARSTVVSATMQDVDVFSIATDEKMAFVHFLKVVDGAIINTFTLEMTKNLNDDETDLLTFAITTLRQQFSSEAPEIIVSHQVEVTDKKIIVTVPKIGDKKKLLELSEKNVKYYLLQKQRDEATKAGKQTSVMRILSTLQKDLRMSVLPTHIECFDNSNIQGSHPVSSCVVFRNAKPSKREYRHYNIKSVTGPNDFASMEEVVFRRYKRLLSEAQPLPELIIIDGGKGQLSAAVKSLEALDIYDKVTVIGIAKKLEEIYFANDSLPLYIDKKSESLKLIQQARNEAHRFAVTFHRTKRSQNFTTTELTDIPGVGTKIAEKLLVHFGSVRKLQSASSEAIEAVIGKTATRKIIDYFTAH